MGDVGGRRDVGEYLQRLQPAFVRILALAVDLRWVPSPPRGRLPSHVNELVAVLADATDEVDEERGGDGALARVR